MPKHTCITDTDFLPRNKFNYLYLHTNERNQQEEEIYQLVFGILKYRNIDLIYHLLIRLVVSQEGEIIKNVKLKLWKEELQKIIASLKRYTKDNKYQVDVILPYLLFNTWIDINVVISYFQWAINIIEEIQNYKEELTVNEKVHLWYPLPSMHVFFITFIINKVYPNIEDCENSEDVLDVMQEPIDLEHLRKDGMFGIGLDLWSDEMIRRGIPLGTIPKSQYYDSEETNYRRYFIEKEFDEDELESEDSTNLSIGDANPNDKEKTAIICFMLQDKVEKQLLSRICNYVAGKKYNTEIRKSNKNSIDRYIRLCQKEELDKDSFTKPMINRIAKLLEEYELEVPKKVKAFLEQ